MHVILEKPLALESTQTVQTHTKDYILFCNVKMQCGISQACHQSYQHYRGWAKKRTVFSKSVTSVHVDI